MQYILPIKKYKQNEYTNEKRAEIKQSNDVLKRKISTMRWFRRATRSASMWATVRANRVNVESSSLPSSRQEPALLTAGDSFSIAGRCKLGSCGNCGPRFFSKSAAILAQRRMRCNVSKSKYLVLLVNLTYL